MSFLIHAGRSQTCCPPGFKDPGHCIIAMLCQDCDWETTFCGHFMDFDQVDKEEDRLIDGHICS